MLQSPGSPDPAMEIDEQLLRGPPGAGEHF